MDKELNFHKESAGDGGKPAPEKRAGLLLLRRLNKTAAGILRRTMGRMSCGEPALWEAPSKAGKQPGVSIFCAAFC